METLKFTAPDGNIFEIRESTGEDEAAISKVGDLQDGSNVTKFISNIIISSSIKEGRLTHEDTAKLKASVRYYILLKSRIFSLGPIMKFGIKFSGELEKNKEYQFTEDLCKFDWDLSTKPPVEGEEEYNPDRIRAYPNGTETERLLTTSSGKEIKYQYLTGNSEKYILQRDTNNVDITLAFSSRELEMKMEGKWVRLQNFRGLTAREMNEIRSDIRINDITFEMNSEVKSPDTGQLLVIPLAAQSDFFFPGEI